MTPSTDACSCCKDQRTAEQKGPRQLKRLPHAIIQDGNFNKPGLPIRLCVHCDGDAYKEAMRTHEERTKPNEK